MRPPKSRPTAQSNFNLALKRARIGLKFEVRGNGRDLRDAHWRSVGIRLNWECSKEGALIEGQTICPVLPEGSREIHPTSQTELLSQEA